MAKKTSPAPAPNGIELPADFADWRLVSASMRADNDTMRAVLGNKAAMRAAREGRVNPWPDGAVLAKVVWRRVDMEEWSTASVPGAFVQVEFMIKNSRKYPETGGWGFARWLGNELKPYGQDAGFVKECFSCHQPVKDRDYVFTRPAAMPLAGR
ncbi:MAG: cytochrome P460 [Elusimicrobia bacterium GWC2_64_44]|nr:MAG: cytochrome P460 [Elusimicrobia bacterium GWC2_64_44]